MFDLVLSFFSIGVYMLVVIGGVALAGVIFFGPWGQFIPASLRAVASAVCLLVSAYAFGFIQGSDQTAMKLAIAESNIKLLEEQMIANNAIHAAALSAATERAINAGNLAQQVNDHRRDLANGQTTACPADDAYTARLHSVLNVTDPAKRPD